MKGMTVGKSSSAIRRSCKRPFDQTIRQNEIVVVDVLNAMQTTNAVKWWCRREVCVPSDNVVLIGSLDMYSKRNDTPTVVQHDGETHVSTPLSVERLPASEPPQRVSLVLRSVERVWRCL